MTATKYVTDGLQFWQQSAMLVIVATLSAWAVVATYFALRKGATITIDNVEGKIKEWVPAFGHSYNWKHNDACYFLYEIKLSTGKHLAVSRSKRLDKYLTLQTALALSESDKETYRNLPAREQRQLFGRVKIALAQSKIGYDYKLPDGQLNLVMNVPITAELTEFLFIRAIEEVELAQILANEILAATIVEARPQAAPQAAP